MLPARFSDYAVGKFENLLSRKSVKKAIKAGSLKIDDEAASTGVWVTPGMKITYEPTESKRKFFDLKIEVVFEDEYLAVVNKPAGLTTSGNKFQTLENTLPLNLTPSNVRPALEYPRPVHRLDHATSGLVIVAKTPQSRILLGEMLEDHQIHKTYHAVVHDIPENETGEIMIPVEEKEAQSSYEVLQISRSKRYSLLKLKPSTGRTHQLRIHCAESGFPIVGDKLYGPGYDPGKGLFLCATSLKFSHPIDSTDVSVVIPLPNKFNRLMSI